MAMSDESNIRATKFVTVYGKRANRKPIAADRRLSSGARYYAKALNNHENGVYLIKAENRNRVKVGVTHNRRRRMYALERASADVLHFVGWVPCSSKYEAHAIEKKLHAVLKAQNRHFRGEWFNLTSVEARWVVEYAVHLRDKRGLTSQ